MRCCVRCGHRLRPQRRYEDGIIGVLPQDFSSLKPNLQLGSREKVIFSLDKNPKRQSVLKHVRTARPDIPVDTCIMKYSMPEIVSEKTKEDNTRAAKVLHDGKFSVNDAKGFHEKMKNLAYKLVAKEIVNLKLAKLIMNYNCALRINESEAGIRAHTPVRSDYCVDNHVLTFAGSCLPLLPSFRLVFPLWNTLRRLSSASVTL